MDTDALKLYAEVMHQRSFAAVARNHRVAPSSVSRCIAGLEDELGIRLFQRSTRKLVPTEAGILYFERIAPLLDELEAAQLMAADISEEPQGNLRITAPSVFAQLKFVPLIPVFAKQYPKIKLELLLTDAYLDLIEERIDVAIRLGSLDDSSYIARRLKSISFYVCASPTYLKACGQPESPEQLSEHNCLLFPRQGFNLNWIFKDKQNNTTEVTITGNCLITQSHAIKYCVQQGMGISLLPDWLVEQDIKDGVLCRLFEDYEVTATNFDTAAWLLYPSRTYLPLKVRVLIDFLLSSRLI